MHRARMLAVAALIVFYGAAGARQPAVRVAVPLPVPAAAIQAAADLPPSDTATLLLNLTRILYDIRPGHDAVAEARRQAARQALFTTSEKPGEPVPLPLDPSIWRDTILEQSTPDAQIVAAILSDRRTALLYHGLSALDDETLAWLGPDHETLQHLRGRPGVFAAFGRSVRIRGTHVAVPGGPEAEPLWASLVGAEPAKAAVFVQRLFRGNGRLAFFYDTLAHLDAPRQRFALGLQLPEASRRERFLALYESFAGGAEAWNVEDTPFVRPALDGAVMLTALRVTPRGELTGPTSRRLWEHVFTDDEHPDAPFTEVPAFVIPRDDPGVIDAAWLAARIATVPNSLGRRRLGVVLFAQRVFGEGSTADPAALATALRAVQSFPALALTLERIGIVQPQAYGDAGRSAEMLTRMRRQTQRRTAVTAFQAALGIIERAQRSGGLEPARARALTAGLLRLHAPGERGFHARLSRWLHAEFAPAFAAPAFAHASAPVETALIAAMAGVTPARPVPVTVQWEGGTYRVDPAAANAARIGRIREHQGGLTLDAALAGVKAAVSTDADSVDAEAERAVAETLASILYADHLGDPDTLAVTSGNVALRHDFGFAAPPRSARSSIPWRLPVEAFGSGEGWHLRGSLLGLEAALGRLVLRRLDPSVMPGEPGLGPSEMHALMVTAALFNPRAMTNSARDEIAAALGRGRARAAALTADPADLDRAALDAGLSEWRRQALSWTLAHDPGRALDQFSLVELFWLGAPRPSLLQTINAWGAAALPLSGCLCLAMPQADAWEDVSGRPSAGLLATRYADVALQVAATLASLDLPAALAPGVISFALQDVIERTQPAYPGDGTAFGRAAAALPRDRIIDYVAALTARGPLLPAERTAAERR